MKLDVLLRRCCGMLVPMQCMTLSDMCVMRRRFSVTLRCVLGRRAVVLSGLLVVVGRRYVEFLQRFHQWSFP